MFANCYGLDGVTKLIQIMKEEIVRDAAQAGVADLTKVSRSVVSSPMCSPDQKEEGKRLTVW